MDKPKCPKCGSMDFRMVQIIEQRRCYTVTDTGLKLVNFYKTVLGENEGGNICECMGCDAPFDIDVLDKWAKKEVKCAQKKKKAKS
jgi:hypothetical protein